MDTEVRSLYAVDGAGRSYMLVRVRGEAPDMLIVDKGTDSEGRAAEVTGQVPIGLRDLMYAIGRQLPLGSVDLDAIAAIGVEGLENGP